MSKFIVVPDAITLKDTVTVRDRDTGKQERIAIEKLRAFIDERLAE